MFELASFKFVDIYPVHQITKLNTSPKFPAIQYPFATNNNRIQAVLPIKSYCLHSLEMLEKTDIPLIPDGYPLVVAMNALMDAVKSVSQVINNKKKAVSVELKEVMLKSSWSGVMAALALLLDTW